MVTTLLTLLTAAVALTGSVDGRSYRVHLPNGQAPAAPAALVVVLHGGGGNADNAARMSGMDAKADREGFIAVYPNGIGPFAGRMLTWNAGRCCGKALDDRVDDTAYVRAVVEAMASRYKVDRKRIYATGMSNGGMMAYRLGCEAADVFAAIAPVSGALNLDDCQPKSRVSLIAFHGTADQHVRFEGGEPLKSVDRHKRTDNSVAFAVDFWKRRDGCSGDAARSRSGNAVHDAWKCEGGTAVELFAIEGHGHAWPDFATDAMWDFFKGHPKP